MSQPPISTPTGFLRDFQRPRRDIVLRAEEDNSSNPIYVHFLIDKSQSYEGHSQPLNAVFQAIIHELLKLPGSDLIHFAATEMSSVVCSSGYQPISRFCLPNLPAGGLSPHAAMLCSARAVDSPLIGKANKTLIRVIACDGMSTDDWKQLEKEVSWLRTAQEKDDSFQVFVVQIGKPCHEDFLSALSINRPKFDVFDYRFDGFIQEIIALVSATMADPTVPARSIALSNIAKPRKTNP